MPPLKPTKPIPKAQRKWVNVTLAGARFQNVDLSNAKIRGAFLRNVEIDGLIQGLKVNGVDVGPLIVKEMARLHPELKVLMAAGKDPKSMRKAWSIIEGQWAQTMQRAEKLTDAQRNKQVDGEWSFNETLRHLVFASDAWFGRTVLSEQEAFWAGGLAHDEMPVWFVQACGLKDKPKPTFTQIKEAREHRLQTIRDHLAALTLDELDRRCKGNKAKAYPTDPKKFTVRNCLMTVISEEWQHHQFAVRDLAVLTA